MATKSQSRQQSLLGIRCGFSIILVAGALQLAAVPVSAQLTFTEFAVTDTSLNSSPSTDFWVASAAPADVDADGDLDLLVAGYFVVYPTEENPDGSVEHRLTLYRNDGPSGEEWRLTPIAVDASGLSAGATDLAWGDYDNDGDPDVVVASEGQTVLYCNQGGTLIRTMTALPAYYESGDFTTMDQRSITWADIDNDGDLDLLLPSIVSQFDYLPTAVLRNDGQGLGGDWTFTDIAADLPIAANAVSAWADMEGDGDLDLLLGNVSPYEDNFLNTYRNEGGTLVPAASGLAFIRYGTADWGDADNDGDLDIVYGGNMDLPDGTGETVVRILFNDGHGGYSPVDVVRDFEVGVPNDEPWLSFSAVTWADYDSDGDMDLLVSGEWLGPVEIEGRAVVYANNGGIFTLASDPLPAPVAGNAGGAFTWFDVDGDGDLDYFVAGGYYVPGGNGLIEARTQLFRNEQPGANAAPASPSGLQARVSGRDVAMSWHSATDDHTPPAAMTYDFAIYSASEGSSLSGLATLGRVLPQAGSIAGETSWTLRGLVPGTYRWTVRAVDNAFNGGPAAEGTFSIASTGTDVVSPQVFALSPAYPTPFRRETRFTLVVRHEEDVRVAVYDVQGHRVAVLCDGPLAPGSHSMTFTAGNLPSGIYFLQARGRDQTVTRGVTLVR